MIGDALATFSTNQRPTFSGLVGVSNPALYAGNAAIWPVPFPNTFVVLGGSPNALDLIGKGDLGRGRSLAMHFHITTTFGGTGTATNSAQFGVIVADDTAFVVNPTIIALGPIISTAGLAANTVVEVAIPPMPTIARLGVTGRRYLGAILQGYVPTNDWDAGAVTVKLMMDSQGQVTHYPSGYSMPGIQGA